MPEAPVAWEANNETAIVDRLKIALPGLAVEPLPDKPWNFTHPRGAALVMFAGMDGGKILNALVAQEVTMEYEVLLISRSLRDHTGLYPMWAATRQALHGWQPPSGKPFSLVRLRNMGYEDGGWRFAVTFKTDTVLVPDIEPDIGPLLTKVEIEFCENLQSS